MNSPCYAPAGLLIEHGNTRVMLDGGPGAEPDGRLDAWLVTDMHSELISRIRTAARRLGTQPAIARFVAGDRSVEPKPVGHTSHPTYGYLVTVSGFRIVWAPEFF